MKPANLWLSRNVATPGPYLTLCLTPEELKETARKLDVWGLHWPEPPANGRAYHLDHSTKGQISIVCVAQTDPPPSSITTAGLLVHEAVHVWQHHIESIGEENPGREQEAYGIQNIAQALMEEYARRMA